MCPECAQRGLRAVDDPFIDGLLVSRDDSIWMHRFCPVHGESESLYEEDAAVWRARHGWQTPTLDIQPDRADNWRGFPEGYLDGLPASHGQHSCILLLNLTEHCNYRCPTCYASALSPGTPLEAPERPTLEELLRTVDTVIDREGGRLNVVMLSGGEPTLRRDFAQILQELAKRPITRVMINTNGRRIVQDPAFRSLIKEHRSQVEVYLQFDGLEDATYEHLRGEPVAAQKLETIRMLDEMGVFMTLVSTIKRGVNEHELPAILDLALSTKHISGLALQPVFGSGRNSGIDPQDRTTPTGVLKRLGDRLKPEDFVPLPCSHRDCCDIAYMVQTSGGEWRSLVSLVGRDEMKRWIHLAANTISFENVQETLKELLTSGVLQRVLSEQQRASSLQTALDLLTMCDCVPGVRDLLGGIWKKAGALDLEKLATKTLRVTVKMFMDAHTFHEARIRQCCVHVGTFEEDPRRHSFCWRYLFEDARDFPARLTELPMR